MKTFKGAFEIVLLTSAALLVTTGIVHAAAGAQGANLYKAAVDLTAMRQSAALPDGKTVPMWGWACGWATGATCTTTNGAPQAGAGVWQPPLIKVPVAMQGKTSLTIALKNTLPIATSLVIVGQIPQPADVTGLGAPVRESGRPQHQPQTATTWPIVSNLDPFTPPTQGPRVRSFVSEAAPAVNGVPGEVTYTWDNLQPGTYLIESGTYPSIQAPMGLYGVLVVTADPVPGNKPALMPQSQFFNSQVNSLGPQGAGAPVPIQDKNKFFQNQISGRTPSLAVTQTLSAPGTAYVLTGAGSTTTAAVQYDADAVILLSEIDPVQNWAADAAIQNQAFLHPADPAVAGEMAKWTPACSSNGPSATANTCYPPVVNYTPVYYLVNGVALDPANPAASQLNAIGSIGDALKASKGILLRFVNAGLHMHVPSTVGLPMTLIAEDGHLQPDVSVAMSKGLFTQSTTGVNPQPKVVSDAFMPAGKALDVLVNPPTRVAAGGVAIYEPASYSVFDRELSLSSGSTMRDSGMHAFLVVNGGPDGYGPGQTNHGQLNAFVHAEAIADDYFLPYGAKVFTGNVLTNDVGVRNSALASSCPRGGALAPETLPVNGGTVTLSPDGNFTLNLAAPLSSGGAVSFMYCGNGNPALVATVTFRSATLGAAPTANADRYTGSVATLMQVHQPGVLLNDTDPNGYQLKAAPVGGKAGAPFRSATGGCTITLQENGAFNAQLPALGAPTAQTCTFTYNAVNAQGTSSAAPATVTLTFPPASGLNVTVQDANSHARIIDYKWIIEQDLTVYQDPACQQNGPGGAKPATCPPGTPTTLGTELHTSYMPVVAAGCTGPQSCERGQSMYDANPSSPTYGQHVPAVCDASGICTPAPDGTTKSTSTPDQVVLNATNPDGTPARYYISILPGDAANAFNNGNGLAPTADCFAPNAGGTATGQVVPTCGHTMGGAPIPAPTCTTTPATGTAPATTTCTFAPVTVNAQPNPLQPATVTVFVFEDDWPVNGEHDGSGNSQSMNGSLEPPLGDFQVVLWDEAGSSGDATGQMTYDMFNMPLTNALAGTIDPLTGLDACPLSPNSSSPVGMIIVCPQFESDGVTPSPLVGQATIKNLMPGRYGVVVHPSAAREAAGEEWLQTNTLDGSHYLDSFVRSGEPAYFQEFGPGGWHVFMGMANPAVINGRKAGLCSGGAVQCNNNVNVYVSSMHQTRSPDESLWDSTVFPLGDPRNYAPLSYTTCYGALQDPDGEAFAFAKCDQNGKMSFTNVPDGNWALVVFDQWLDFIVDGSSKPVNVTGGQTLNMDYSVFTWQQHIWTTTYLDTNGNGIQDAGEPGLMAVPSRVRFRNGRFSNSLFSDITGQAHFDEVFPLFNWYVIESDTTRFRGTGVHIVNDGGGQLDGPAPMGNGRAGAYQGLLSTAEKFSLPNNLRYPGSYYCQFGDCSELAGLAGAPPVGGPGGSTGRIDPGTVETEGLEGQLGEFQLLEWGKMPYAPGENGGIRGHVVYASTRPFDDPQILFQNLWAPLVPNVTVNLYQEISNPDGTVSLKLIDTTLSSSWDAYTQGFQPDGVTPNMSCPGEDALDPFFGYTLAGTKMYLNPGTTTKPNTLPYNSQYKCFDSFHILNQIQPAPYDGLWEFPSATCKNTAGATYTVASGPLAGQKISCATVANPAYNATINGVFQTGAVPAVLPAGKYVVEIVPPPGFEVVKEEDKNILIGDNYIAPVTMQFAGLGDIFIVPDQATLNSAGNPWFGANYGNPSYTGPVTGSGNPYNPNGTPTGNNSNPTSNMGRTGIGDEGPGGLTVMPSPCVGALRTVPDYLSISPESGEVAPFAGALRNLCDRREVTLDDQMQAQTDFFVFTKTPAASHFTGYITDDFASEFDPTSPAFGEKFALPNVPVSIRDFNGMEISRVYSDAFGDFNGMVYSTWEVNPPNPTGYAPNMVLTCMNDRGPILDTRKTILNSTGQTVANPTYGQMIDDPMFNPAYSTFCYENPFMPQDTTYLDTPVVPVSAFAEGYNPPDCAYPDATPAIQSVTGDVVPANTAAGSTGTGAGPWVAAAGHTITITALGDQSVLNHAYAGPSANTPPYNQKFVMRHYGFGPQGTVTIGGIQAAVTGWSDTAITVTVPNGLPMCAQSWAQPPLTQNGGDADPNAASGGGDGGGAGDGSAQALASFGSCGQLVITSGNGKQSIDAVTVTVGGNAPTYISGENSSNHAIQAAIDNAAPGDLILVGPGTYTEILLMWKPVRLQGVGASLAKISASAHPSSDAKLGAWRQELNCLFGLGLNGNFISASNPYDPTGAVACPANMMGAVDPIQFEAMLGWSVVSNANLAGMLQEPTLMGAYEGAGITVLGKGVRFPANGPKFDPVAGAATGTFAPGTVALTNSAQDCNDYPSNFLCSPSSIDGLTITNSSQGGGGILIHGWNHYLQVSNNRIYGNTGTLTGGITLGQPENAPLVTSIVTPTTPLPSTPLFGEQNATGTPPPGGYFAFNPLYQNTHVHITHNWVSLNSSIGDEIGSSTPSAGGGVSVCTGSDYYLFDYNWVCGNLSTGDGGGMRQFGYSINATIAHNAFLFNQSNNPTLPTHGGGLTVMGESPDGLFCENAAPVVDLLDCPPSLSDGVGAGMVIDSNLFMGNAAESGNGGGLRLQNVNGNDVTNNPTNPAGWYQVNITNNIFANNIAGWAGGGVSMQDAVYVNFSNNTVTSNDSTASAGVLFDTLGAPIAAVPPPGCEPISGVGCNNPVTNSNFEPAGLVVHQNTIQFQLVFPHPTPANPNVVPVCPAGHPNCSQFSNPVMNNDIFWQNRAFHITVGAPPLAVVQLTPALTQATTGACPAGAYYWDYGVYGDTAPTNHSSGLTLAASGGYTGTANPGFVSQYCNGSRVPPEIAPLLCAGPNGNANAPGCVQPGTVGVSMTVPQGVPDALTPWPKFTLTPTATVDEGNNWINMFFGPLSTVNSTIPAGTAGYGMPLGNYSAPAAGGAGPAGVVGP